jgi:flagellar biosynthesis protein FlhG
MMLDQASVLRGIPVHTPDVNSDLPCPQPVAIAITSGQGGVGKTNVVANLAVSLAGMRKRVTILDADSGLANIDVLLGLAPEHNLKNYVLGDVEMEDIILNGPAGTRIIPASWGVEQIADLTLDQQRRMVCGISSLAQKTDYLLIDAGAGVSWNVINFLRASSLVIIVTTPEPESIIDAYLMVKILAHREKDKRVLILVNAVTGAGEAQRAFRAIDSASRKFLEKPLELLGFIETDANVSDATRQRRPVVELYPQSAAARCVNAIARTLDQQFHSLKRQSGGSLSWTPLFEPCGQIQHEQALFQR